MRRALLPAAVLAATTLAAGCGGSPDAEPVATTEVEMAKSYRYVCTLHRRDMDGEVVVE